LNWFQDDFPDERHFSDTDEDDDLYDDDGTLISDEEEDNESGFLSQK
jgi:hypothetical protein